MMKYDGAVEMKPEERLNKITSILAAGILRLRHRIALPADNGPKITPESSSDGLDVVDETVLSVVRG
ncbi:MAG: hypothetical protein L0228_10580 [Planctomycetes bacterium]|nr:hypothetical protein [Planctomycetota bacterium]